jgi:hypothetical protein
MRIKNRVTERDRDERSPSDGFMPSFVQESVLQKASQNQRFLTWTYVQVLRNWEGWRRCRHLNVPEQRFDLMLRQVLPVRIAKRDPFLPESQTRRGAQE